MRVNEEVVKWKKWFYCLGMCWIRLSLSKLNSRSTPWENFLKLPPKRLMQWRTIKSILYTWQNELSCMQIHFRYWNQKHIWMHKICLESVICSGKMDVEWNLPQQFKTQTTTVQPHNKYRNHSWQVYISPFYCISWIALEPYTQFAMLLFYSDCPLYMDTCYLLNTKK